MTSPARRDASRLTAFSLLAATGALLAAGGIVRLAAGGTAGAPLWMAAGALGAAYAAWNVAASLVQRRLGVDVIALLALIGALAVGEDLAAAVISLMVATGQALEGWAAGRARHDLHALLARAPRQARRYTPGGTLETVPAEAVAPGDRLVVGTGESVPADGVLAADAVLDESALTGESQPVDRRAADAVRSGALNAGPPFDMTVTAPSAESTYAGIVRLVREAESSQAPFVRLADRYALWLLPVTLVIGATAWAVGGAPRAVAVLVVATPCPLILAAPIALVSGLSKAARRGVVIKGGGVLERLARCTTVLIDKTGTLTAGHPTMTAVTAAGELTADEILAMAGSLDQVSAHVLARAVVRAALDRGCRLSLPTEVDEVPGQGIRGTVDGHRVAVGKAAWVGVTGAPAWARSARRRARLDGSLTVFVAVDGKPAGVLVLDDPVRPDAASTIRALRRSGISRVVMLTGDRREVAETVGAVIGVDEVLAERSPAEKLDAVRMERDRAPTIMVGDGVNDAPALALSDVGVAMGARGSAASSETADVVLTVDQLARIGEARRLARRSRAIAVQSVVAGMAMSLAAMGVATTGHLPAVWGALLQEGIDVAAILNALRALRPVPGEIRLAEKDTAITRRFQGEHRAIRAEIEKVREAADLLGSVEPGLAMDRVAGVRRMLVEDVGPHEAAEQAVLYPALDRLLGGTDATGPMSRAHIEIAHQIRRLGQLVDDIGPEGPDGEELADLRSLLYGLYAVLKLHTAQEDENYLYVADVSEALPGEPEPVGSAKPPSA